MGNRLSTTGNKFKMKFRKVNGTEFYGQFLEIPDTSRVSNFLSPRRYLRTGPLTNVKPCDVIIANKVKYIVGEHGDGFYKEVIYKHFKLFQVDSEFTWTRKTSVTDPITGIVKTGLDPQPTTVYISMQPKSDIEDSVNIPQQTYTAISNLAVSRGETIDRFLVTKVDKVLGVYLLEMKEI